MSWWSDPINFIIQWLRGVFLGWGMPAQTADFWLGVVGAAAICLCAMLFVVFLIWYERKLIGRIQDRFGPNRVGPWGLIQPIADMLKIFTKEYITPDGADRIFYNLAPILSVGSVLLIWAVVPFMKTVVGVDLNIGVLYLLAAGGFGTLATLMAGWGSNNKYSLMGAFRAVGIMISYEIPMILSLMIPVMLTGTLSINGIVAKQDIWMIVYAPAAALIFFITSVAETGRAPFDIVEAESELVAGFTTEYSGLKFGMFYVAEFLHAFTISLLFVTLFLGGYRGPGADQYPVLGFFYLALKTFIVYLLPILTRGSLPRFRIDQTLNLSWKILTPIGLALLMVTALVDVALRGQATAIRVVSLCLANIGLLWVALAFVEHGIKPRRRIVGPIRPVAVPPKRQPEA